MRELDRSVVLSAQWGSKKGRGTGIDFAIAPRDAGVDRDGQNELGHISGERKIVYGRTCGDKTQKVAFNTVPEKPPTQLSGETKIRYPTEN